MRRAVALWIGLALLRAAAMVAAPVWECGGPPPAERPARDMPDLGAFREGFCARPGRIVNLALDARDRLWLVLADPDVFVRLDADGAVVERVPFERGASGALTSPSNDPFAVLSDGRFALGAMVYGRDGRIEGERDGPQALDLWPGRDGAVFRLSGGAVERLSGTGAVLRRWGRGGYAVGQWNDPRAVAAVRDRVYVADARSRVQRLVRDGSAPVAVRVSSNPMTWIADIAADSRGRLYVATANDRGIVILDPDLRELAAIRLSVQALAVDRHGRVYSLFGDGVLELVPQAGGLPPAAAGSGVLAPDDSGADTRPAQGRPLRVDAEPAPPFPYEIQSSTAEVEDLAADPRRRGRVWVATRGGLLRVDAAADGSTTVVRYGVRQGLMRGELQSVASDGSTVWIGGAGGLQRLRVDDGSIQTLRIADADVQGSGVRRIALDPSRPGDVWCFTWREALRLDAATQAWTVWQPPGALRDGRVLPDGTVLVATVDGLWQLDVAADAWRRRVGPQALDRAARQRQSPEERLELSRLEVDSAGQRVWLLSAWGAMAFRFDLRSGRLDWPAWNLGDCRPNGLLAGGVDGDALIVGSRCLAAVGDAAAAQWTLAVPFQKLPAAFRDGDDRVWLGTERGLWRLSGRGAAARLDSVSSGAAEPDGTWAQRVIPFGGRLWVAFANRGLGAFDPAARSWRNDPGFTARVLRLSADGGQIWAEGYGPGCQNCLRRYDADVRPIGAAIDFARGPWWSAIDFEPAGDTLWLAGNRHAGSDSIGRLGSDGTFQEWLIGDREYSLPRQLAVDPELPGVLWVASPSAELVRLDSATGAIQRLRTKVRTVRRIGRWLWIDGDPSARLDPRSGELLELPPYSVPFASADPNRVWLRKDSTLTLCELPSGTAIAQVALEAGPIYEDAVELGDTLWVGSTSGLIAVPWRGLRPPGNAEACKVRASVLEGVGAAARTTDR